MQSAVEILRELVRIESVNPNYEGGLGEGRLAAWVMNFFESRGISCYQQLVFPDRPNVIARIPGSVPGRRVVLEAHLDTVSVANMEVSPFSAEVRNGQLFGRGACDTKGGLAAMMHAVARLHAEKVQPACEVLLAATVDEEFSYRGVMALCNSLKPGPVPQSVLEQNGEDLVWQQSQTAAPPWSAELAIVAEPTELRPVTSSKGVVRWTIETQGIAAHSAKPHLGVNAIEHMAHVVCALEADQSRLAHHRHPLLGPATCNVGLIRGGVQVNFVPDRCQIEVDRRLLPGETAPHVLAQYQRLLDNLSDEVEGLSCTMHPPRLSDLPLQTDPELPPVKRFRQALDACGLDSTPTGVPFGSDASKLSAIGIPSIIFGPGSIDQAHAAVEYVDCEQVTTAAEILFQFLIDYV